MADRMRPVDELLAAATAALGVTLAAPRNLGGNEQSTVLRCLQQDGGSVIVKAYQDDGVGRECFAAEAAGLTLTGGTGLGPQLLAASRAERMIVMTDLGNWPSLADVLLGASAGDAEEALLSWVRACGELAVAIAGREPDLARLLAAYRTGPAPGPAGQWLRRRIGEIPGLLASLSIPAPPGLRRELAEVASILDRPWYDVFSPGDICPDNNLLTTGECGSSTTRAPGSILPSWMPRTCGCRSARAGACSGCPMAWRRGPSASTGNWSARCIRSWPATMSGCQACGWR